jgi:hypothetical protein
MHERRRPTGGKGTADAAPRAGWWTQGSLGIGALAASLGLLGAAFGGGCGEKVKAGFGDACALDEECATGECAAIGRFCSKGCTYDRECGAGYVCRVRDGRPGNVCSKPQGQPPGGTCMTAVECQHGRCLHRAGEEDKPGFCSVHCRGPEDCPAGLKACEAVSDSGALKLCLLVDEKAPLAERPKIAEPREAPEKPRATGSAVPVATAIPLNVDLPRPAVADAGAPAKPSGGADARRPGGTPILPQPPDR